MNIESKQYDTASKMMEERRGNCAQAIFAMYGPQISLGKVDCNSCMRITSAFGGGINRTGNVCGALTGALMVLGIKYGGNVQEVTKISKQFLDEFTSINGSIICRDLIGHDLFDDEDLKKAFASNAFKKCMKYVDDAARLLEKYVDKHDTKEGD
ncbi:MAG: C_GCAxxG_C_C family protein [Asgard group archaeon]|nr:C_GCAxxG_C_C family protein [Asgard group archaeon]